MSDEQGRLAIAYGTRHDDENTQNISDIAKISELATETTIKYYPATSIYGCILLIDVINTTVRHIAQFRPYTLMNIAYAWQNHPTRFRLITMFNAPTFFYFTVRILKSFMTEKMKNRIHVYSTHRTMENCFKDVPANILPVEYGGTDGTIQELTEFWKKLIEENRDWFVDEEDDKSF